MTTTAAFSNAKQSGIIFTVDGLQQGCACHVNGSSVVIDGDTDVSQKLKDFLALGGTIVPYAAPAFDPVAYAAAKADGLVIAVGNYTVSGTTVQCDCDQGTIADLLALKSWGASNPTATSRFVQNNGSVVLLTGNQYVALAGLVGPIRLAIYNTLGTVIQGIMGGTITTQAQVDAAAWPALSGTA